MRIILITLILIVNLSHPLFAKIASVIGNPISQEIYFEVNKDTKNLINILELAKNINCKGFITIGSYEEYGVFKNDLSVFHLGEFDKETRINYNINNYGLYTQYRDSKKQKK